MLCSRVELSGNRVAARVVLCLDCFLNLNAIIRCVVDERLSSAVVGVPFYISSRECARASHALCACARPFGRSVDVRRRSAELQIVCVRGDCVAITHPHLVAHAPRAPCWCFPLSTTHCLHARSSAQFCVKHIDGWVVWSDQIGMPGCERSNSNAPAAVNGGCEKRVRVAAMRAIWTDMFACQWQGGSTIRFELELLPVDPDHIAQHINGTIHSLSDNYYYSNSQLAHKMCAATSFREGALICAFYNGNTVGVCVGRTCCLCLLYVRNIDELMRGGGAKKRHLRRLLSAVSQQTHTCSYNN